MLVSYYCHSKLVGGVRVVSTRRPITPREPGRVLYGKVTLPGRPPSAFSYEYFNFVLLFQINNGIFYFLTLVCVICKM